MPMPTIPPAILKKAAALVLGGAAVNEYVKYDSEFEHSYRLWLKNPKPNWPAYRSNRSEFRSMTGRHHLDSLTFREKVDHFIQRPMSVFFRRAAYEGDQISVSAKKTIDMLVEQKNQYFVRKAIKG